MFRILLADDEPHHMRRLTSLVQESGLPFEVCGSAHDGRRVLEMASDLQPDLLISDIRMPFRNGLNVAEAIKKDKPDLPIVLVSAYQNFEYARRGIQLGILDYLLKPVNREDVRKVLEQAALSLTEKRNNMLRSHFFQWTKHSGELPVSLRSTLDHLAPYRLALYLNQPASGLSLSSLWKNADINIPAFFLEIETRGDGSRLFLLTSSSSVGDRSPRESGIEKGILVFSGENIPCEEWGRTCRFLSHHLWETGRWGDSGVFNGQEDYPLIGSSLILPEEERTLKALLKEEIGGGFFPALDKLFQKGFQRHIPLIALAEGLRNLGQIIIECYGLKQNIPAARIHQIMEELIRDLPKLGFRPGNIVGELKNRLHSAVPEKESDFFSVTQVRDYICRNFKSNIDSSGLADLWGISPSVLNIRFKEKYGQTPTKYLISVRMEAAKEYLSSHPEMQIKEIARESGYEDPLYFSRIFHRKTGLYPTEYRTHLDH